MQILSSELGHAVHQRLSQFVRLPSFGVASGQAVSNAVLELLNRPGVGPYRDIDIFISTREVALAEQHAQSWFNLFKRPKWNLTEHPTDVNAWQAGWDSDYDILGFQSSKIYGVRGSAHVGKLNYIIVAPYVTWYPSNLFMGMDLSNCQVGLDLQTKKLFWSQAFADFVRTGELRFTNLRAPVSALLRFLSKKDELQGVTANVDRAIEEVILSSCSPGCAFPKGRYYAIPTKLLPLVEQYWPVLEPHFQLEEPEDQANSTREQLPRLVPKHHPSTPYMSAFKVFADYSSPHPHALCAAIANNEVPEKQRAIIEVIAKLIGHHPLKQALRAYGPSFIDDATSVEDVQMLIEFCASRGGVGIHRLRRLSDWMAAARFILAAEMRHGIWVSGAMHPVHPGQLARMSPEQQAFATTLVTDFLKEVDGEWVLVSQEEFDAHVQQALPLLDQPLRAKQDLPAFGEGVQVEELVTARQRLSVDHELRLSDTPGWFATMYGSPEQLFVVRTPGDVSLIIALNPTNVHQSGMGGGGPSHKHRAIRSELLEKVYGFKTRTDPSPA